jgi:glycerol-3-phosphate acyltransferase PlsY
MTITIALFLAGTYLLGSIPFGLWIALWLKGVDVRTLGSGNIGATNVSRVCGPQIGRLVFALDFFKGLVPPLVGRWVLHLDRPDSRWIVLCALLAILGHNYSIFLGFKGGKGISSSGGALFGAAPLTGLGATVAFAALVLSTSMISVGSLAAAVSLPFLMALFYPRDWFQLAFGILASAMAIYKHRANIARLRAGAEPKVHLFGKRATAAAEPADGHALSDAERDASAAPRTEPFEKESPTDAAR